MGMARTNYSAYMAIKRQLLQIFKTEKFENNKLPPESALAARLGISLVTLREALLMLALEGYITKRHGSGNYIHPSALDYENRSYYFCDCLENDGYETDIKLMKHEVIPIADPEAAEHLGIQLGDDVLQNTLYYMADGQPAIVTIGNIPASILVREDLRVEDFHHVHVLISKYTHRDLAHSLNEYLPMGLPEDLVPVFGLPAGTPIIGSKQTFYDVQDNPVLYNTHYFYPNRYRVKALQNWDLGK